MKVEERLINNNEIIWGWSEVSVFEDTSLHSFVNRIVRPVLHNTSGLESVAFNYPTFKFEYRWKEEI